MYLPKEIQKCIFSYLHQPYDYEKKKVIDELQSKCSVFGDKINYLQFVPALLLPTKCVYRNLQSKFRSRYNKMSITKCICGFCQNDLWCYY